MYSTCMASFCETLESSMKYNEPTQVLNTQWETLEYCCSQNCMLAVWKSDKTKSSLNCSFEEMTFRGVGLPVRRVWPQLEGLRRKCGE